MALPAGVTTATVTVGVPVTHTGAEVKTFVSIEPSAFLVHAATGTPLVDFLEELSINEGVAGQFTLPHTDQAGFTDESGNSYTNWYYTARVTYSTPSKAKNKAPKVKVFQLTTGQTTVDLDQLPGGAPALPYIAPTAKVDAFNGRTGAVTLLDADLPERLSDAELSATFAHVRAALYDDTAAKPDGTPTAFTSGQPLTLFGNAHLTIADGAYTHTPFAGVNSAGYVQADMGPLTPDHDGIYHIGADVSWPTSDVAAVALVLSDGAWTDTPVPVRSVAKVHGVFYGNVMHVSTFNAPGETKYIDTSVASSDPAYVPKYKDLRGNPAFHPLDIQFDPATGDIVVVRPDGSTVTKNVPALVGFKPRHASWELYEPNGTGIQSAKFRNPRVSVGPRPAGGMIPTKADVGYLVSKAAVPTRLLKTSTQYRPAATETILTPTGTAAEIVGTGAVQITRISGVIPDSGKFMVRIKGYLVTADMRSIFWNLINTDTAATITSRRVVDGAEAAGSKWIDEEFYITGDTPGVTRNLSFHHLAGGTGTPATGITAGQNPSRPVTVEFVPVN